MSVTVAHSPEPFNARAGRHMLYKNAIAAKISLLTGIILRNMTSAVMVWQLGCCSRACVVSWADLAADMRYVLR